MAYVGALDEPKVVTVVYPNGLVGKTVQCVILVGVFPPPGSVVTVVVVVGLEVLEICQNPVVGILFVVTITSSLLV